jgi:glycosyltransferase involved in cell wall biosynthesis
VLIVTDAWHPQVNGVVRSIERTADELTRRGATVRLITPAEFRTFPMPGYDEIALSATLPGPVHRRIDDIRPDAVHLATEGPLGIFARRWCLKHKVPFSSAYHTQFPEYLRARVPVPLWFTYAYLRWFHGPSSACLVGTPYLKGLLEKRGFTNIQLWPKGVDIQSFRPDNRTKLDYSAPVFLYVGRVAVEKNIEAFLRLELPGTKVVVGGGPLLEQLKTKYPEVVFLGPKVGEELARLYASADVFVFPSRTDTFGLVLLEALASGTPVAAYPVTGPIDVIGTAPVGVLDDDLQKAALAALDIPRDACRRYAETFSWSASTDAFLKHLPVRTVRSTALAPNSSRPASP